MKFENNLQMWREGASLSREQLAEKVGISSTSIYRIETGRQQPRPELLAKICSVFDRRPSDFYASGISPDVIHIGNRRIPVLDFVQAGEFTMIPTKPFEADEYILTTREPSQGSFALRIRGRSMEPDFREGDLVIFDPAIYPRAEDFVVAVNEAGEATFKRFHDAGINSSGRNVFSLVSLNPAYPTWRSDQVRIEIKGTMIEYRRFRPR